MSWRDDVRRANETLDWIEQRQGPLPESGYARIETDVRTVRAMAEGQDDARVQEIRARHEAATPGPWQTWPDGTEESVESVSVGRFVCHLNSNMRQFRDDAAFIAHARQDVPWLLARLDALEAERDYLESGFKTLLEAGKTQRDRARKAEAERDVLRVERDIARRVEQESSAAADAWQAEAVKVRGERDALTAERDAAKLELLSREEAERVRTQRQTDTFKRLAREKIDAFAERDTLAARLAAAEAALVAYADLIDYKPFMEFERAFNSILDNESAPSEPDERERWLIRQAWVAAMNVAHDALAGSREQAAGEGE